MCWIGDIGHNRCWINHCIYGGIAVTSKTLFERKTPSEKLWLLAGELLRDQGIEDVTSHHLATLFGQAITCVAIYNTVDPLDPRSLEPVVEQAIDAALDSHEYFLEKVAEF